MPGGVCRNPPLGSRVFENNLPRHTGLCPFGIFTVWRGSWIEQMETQLTFTFDPIEPPVAVFEKPSHRERPERPDTRYLRHVVLDAGQMKRAAEHWRQEYGDAIPF